MLTITLKRKFYNRKGEEIAAIEIQTTEEDEITLAEDIISDYQAYVFPGSS